MSPTIPRFALSVGLLAVVPSPLSAGERAAAISVPNPLWCLPFALLLLSIAILPIAPVLRHWWDRHHVKLLVGLALGGIVLLHYAVRGFGIHGRKPGAETLLTVLDRAVLEDYVPFMTLLFSLFVISGGLQLRGDLRAKPAVNSAFLGLGALLAGLIGTTGASMVLIRPLLQTNRERKHIAHTVVFFIFLVSNIGGCLTPIGDPPLFLGYLKGVPFSWTFRLAPAWIFCIAILLAIHHVWDRIAYRSESAADLLRDELEIEPPRLRGTINAVWLLGVVLAVALPIPGRFARVILMLGFAGLSLWTTPRGLREETEFRYGAIIEVACLFLGIFLTMQVPIEILQARGGDLRLGTPSHFFWATGALSSVLDNAPTYVVFFETAKSLGIAPGAPSLALADGSLIRADLLAAISLGSVLMGANTYIGNGPNLMVKAIAEERGVVMPGFFSYMLYSAFVLIPLFAAVAFLFL